MTLSTPVKIVALAALALALGLGGVMMVVAKKSPAAPITVPPIVHHRVAVVRTRGVKPKAEPVHPKVMLNRGLPLVVRSGLERRVNAVVVIYSSRVPADRAMFSEAAAAARMTHAAFAPANVAINGIAAAVAGWSAGVSDPAVIVIRRPGNIIFGAAGLTDRQALAQAILAK